MVADEALKPNLDAAVAYLKWHRPAGPWVLTSISNDRKNHDTVTETFRVGEEDRMAAWIDRQNAELGRNVYYHVNATLRLLSKKAEKTDMASMDWLHVDIDPMPGKPIDAERARILAMLGAHEGLPAPSAVVFSGGGYQAFWRLKDGARIDGDVAKAEDLERYNLQVELLTGADACHNCDRIMRLPGTINHPSDKKRAKGQLPVLAYVLEQHDERVYPLSAFTKAVVVSEASPASETTVKVSGVRRHVVLDELPKELNDRIKVIIRQGKDEDQPLAGKDQSRSAWLLHAVGALVRCENMADDTVYAIITDPEYGISASVLDKGSSAQVNRYALRQIKRAKEEKIAPELLEMNDKYAVVESIGGKTRIMKETYDDVRKVPDVEFLQVDGFKLYHGNRSVLVKVGKDANGNDKLKFVPLGEWWLHHPEGRRYEKVVFAPGVVLPEAQFNLWQGFAFDPKRGDCSLFLAHVRDNVCSGSEEHYAYLIRWMARMVQHPEWQAEVAVVLRGKKGTGKGRFARWFGKLFGQHYKYVANPDHITGKFNSALMVAKVVFADEVFLPKDKSHEAAMKALITEETIRVEPKGVDTLEVRNFVALIMATNEKWVWPATMDERRFFILESGEKQRRNREYFAAIEKQMNEGGYEALLHHLLFEVDLMGWEHTAMPTTDELRRQQDLSMSELEQWWQSVLEDGAFDCVVWENRPGRPKRKPLYELIRAACPRRALSEAEIRGFLASRGARKREGKAGAGIFDDFPPLAACRASWQKERGRAFTSNGRKDWGAAEGESGAESDAGEPF